MCVFDRGFELNRNMTSFEIKFFEPEITAIALMEGTIKLFSTDWTVSGITHTTISMLCNEFSKRSGWKTNFLLLLSLVLFEIITENMEVTQIVGCDVIERNGKLHVIVTNIRSTLKLGSYFLQFKSDTANPFVTKMINHVVNANWKLIFAENEMNFRKTIAATTQSVFAPIFDKFAMQEFFQENCEWKN